ncbi:mRNA interferase [Neisseria animalis]|uniref:mRNA interferase n=1 Tax=Neisseria animalis TaxID=492 RepID=A0A5P3MUT8_NEIAN|nr:mRNA interferase [Neisseria animalis]QEY24531.1 mRNA interferase [Neisseria animalis]ROW33136.1 mRNA interferase [Neisseria animalis]
MQYREFKKWLLIHGVALTNDKRGSRQLIRLGDKTSVFLNDGSKEIGTALVNQIKKDLNSK